MLFILQHYNENLKHIFLEMKSYGLVPNFYIKYICERLEIYKSLTDARMWKLGQDIIILFWKWQATQFHFWEYINQNQTIILDFHRPFICSVAQNRKLLYYGMEK